MTLFGKWKLSIIQNIIFLLKKCKTIKLLSNSL